MNFNKIEKNSWISSEVSKFGLGAVVESGCDSLKERVVWVGGPDRDGRERWDCKPQVTSLFIR